MDKKAYQEYVSKTTPKTNELKTILVAFFVGGCISIIAEGVKDILTLIFPSFDIKDIASLTTIIMIFLGGFFTALGIYDKLGYYAGAGSVLPITGFANSVVSPAMEYNKEGIVFGVMAKMFTIAGPVIVTGISASVLVGIIYYLLGLMGVVV